MNHNMQGPNGSHIPPVMPLPMGQRRQDYHTYHMPPPHYGYPAPYYAPPPHYPPQRWPPHYQQSQHYAPPQQMPQPQYQPRSPMVVSSQPYAQSSPLRPNFPVPPQHTQSPRPNLPHTSSSSSVRPSPAQTPVRKQEQPVAAPTTPSHPQPLPQTPAPQPQPPAVEPDPLTLPPEYKQPFWPKLPWYSVSEDKTVFPARATARRRRRRHLRAPNSVVALPTRKEDAEHVAESSEPQPPSVDDLPSDESTIAAPSEPETPATSQAPSESEYTRVSTPATPVQGSELSPKPTPTQKPLQRDTRTTIAVPNLPNLQRPKEASSPVKSSKQDATATADTTGTASSDGQAVANAAPAEAAPAEETESAEIKTPAAPKSWADLVRRNAPVLLSATHVNGDFVSNGINLPKSATLGDALRQYQVQNDTNLSFLEPRGLVNTGNMCYMNSILQILVFCVPFYSFLDQVRQRTVHSIKSDTPLVDAMIMFMREFKVLSCADSVAALRSSLKQEQMETYGEPVTPEYVYDVIRKLPRFAGMRRGHQQDAEEFLGFLLEGLHDECVYVMRGQVVDQATDNTDGASDNGEAAASGDGWLEVGPKQKASVTRTAGQQDVPSPITKIFGGNLRSELRVPGLKDSVTLEPYKPLQLDIGAPHVNNIVDALKGLTRTEALTGDFGGRGNTAKKQVFIEDLPPVLILHLKRFQYDNNLVGTQKIWKKVGYPLELEIPKEVFPPARRGGLAIKGGSPRYRLTSVVYHHGKSAAGGHYTVDVLRQDSREWVRMDDTAIRRIRPEDVAEGGAEEDPKVLARALEQQKAAELDDRHLNKQRNLFQDLDDSAAGDDDADTDDGNKPWSEVNLAGGSGPNGSGHAKKWSGVVNGLVPSPAGSTASGKRTPTSSASANARKESVRDNKVAYILLYERMW